MRLRTIIFLWVSLATVVPLTATVLLATAQSERLHRAEVDEQLSVTLGSVVAEIERRLRHERDFVTALSTSRPLADFRPVLEQAGRRQRHREYRARAARLASFIEEFQSVVTDIGSVRVLDARGNTLIKVRDGVRTDLAFEGIDPYPYAEEELTDLRFRAELASLPAGEVSYVLVPPTRSEYSDFGPPPMLDAAVPLQGAQGERIGYLLVSSTGLQIDRILELSPRLGTGRLAIAEINPDVRDRNGLLLYDDAQGLLFSTAKDSRSNLTRLFDGDLARALEDRPSGTFTSRDGQWRVYYSEYLPYANQLVSWVMVLAIDTSEISAPFTRIRAASFGFAAIALLLALGLAQVGARRVAQPVSELAESLKAYARGQRVTVRTQGAAQEIRELGSAFEYMADTLERAKQERDRAEIMMRQSAKLASIGEMAAGIGHEINNPLNNILSLAKLLKRASQSGDDRQLRDIDALIDEANRASRIVGGVLNFARQVPPEYSTIDGRIWLEGTVSLVAQAAREAGVTVKINAPSDLSFDGDANQLTQVLVNLLLNAVQASTAGQEVDVEASSLETGEVEILVKDEGTGIDPDIMNKLFDPFFTTKPVGKGSGLGLSVSLGIIEHHGGQLSLENNLLRGVTARIRLPRRRAQGVSEP